MAKLKATPKNFADAARVLGDKSAVRLGNNTHLIKINERVYSGGAVVEERTIIAVQLHDTLIVKFWPDGRVTLHSGGYRTVTTKDRINQFIKGRIYQKAHVWYYVRQRGELGLDWGSPFEFYEGLDAAA